MVKRAQYKIQQMAFMILAIFFFFALVGIFFVGWQYTNIQSNFAKLQEEKALSALKVIADSTELNCEQSEDWCIDRDKLTAFSEFSDLYDGYWGIASIELLIVHPKQGQRVVSMDYVPPLTPTGGDSGCSSKTDHSGDGNPDFLVPSCGSESLMNPVGSPVSKKVQANHKAPYHGGQINKVFNVKAGQYVKLSSVSGRVSFDSGARWGNCGSGAAMYGGFYSKNNNKKAEYKLSKLKKGNGKKVPSGATKFIVYAKEQNQHSTKYGDNVGSCSFKAQKYELFSTVGPCDGDPGDFHLDPKHGDPDHQASRALGDAKPPLTVYDNLVPGEIIKFENLVGDITYSNQANANVASCRAGAGGNAYGGAVGGFYTADDKYIRERPLIDFEDGEEVPNNAKYLYVYAIESDLHNTDYRDNTGGCDFSAKRMMIEECPIPEPEDEESVDFSGSTGDVEFLPSTNQEAIQCPAPNCDYYVLYDSGQKNKQLFSAYVNVCEDVDRSHEVCELGKLMLGVRIADDDN